VKAQQKTEIHRLLLERMGIFRELIDVLKRKK
jgi:hypothetical protein